MTKNKLYWTNTKGTINLRNYKENPCYICDNRKQECHSTCTIYKEWRDKMNELNATAQKEKSKFYNSLFYARRSRK